MDYPNKPDQERPEYNRPKEEDTEKRQEQIAAYVEGEMTAEQAAAFEQRMQEDEGLRREVEEWRNALKAAREWVELKAPGVERVANLKVPSVAGRKIPRTQLARFFSVVLRPYAWRGLAAAALFVAGFLLGHLTHREAALVDTERLTITSEKVMTPEPKKIETEQDKVRPVQVSPVTREVVEREVASIPSSLYRAEENGRLIIETTLKGSGARALWVVDGGFQLAKSTRNQ